MFKHIFRVFVVLAVTVSFGFLKNVLLGLRPSKADFGLFNLVMTRVRLIYPLALLGQQNALVRVLSRSRPEDYDWRRYVHRCLPLMGPLAAVLAASAALLYGPGTDALLFLLVAALAVHGRGLVFVRPPGRGPLRTRHFVASQRPGGLARRLSFAHVPGCGEFKSHVCGFRSCLPVPRRGCGCHHVQDRRVGVPCPGQAEFYRRLFILGADFSLLVVASVDKLSTDRCGLFCRLAASKRHTGFCRSAG